jgi:hypothetical protein
MRVIVVTHCTHLPINIKHGECDGKRVDGMYVKVTHDDGIEQIYAAVYVHPEEEMEKVIALHTNYLRTKDELYTNYYKDQLKLKHL